MHKLIMRLGVVCIILMTVFILPSLANAQGAFLYNIKGGGSFNASDLNGTWQFSDGEFYGELDISNSGSDISGSVEVPEGGIVNITSGNLSLDADGVVTGTLTVQGDEGEETITIDAGKMDQGKALFVVVMTTTDGEVVCFLAKAGGQTSDLAGTWHIMGGGDEEFGSGTIVLNNLGTVTGGSFTNTEDETSTFESGNLSVDGNGMITGSITDTDQETGNVIYGFMSQDRTEIFLLIGPSEQDFIAVFGIKGGGSFSTANLAGTWYAYGGESEGVLYGTVTVNASGTITSGTMTTLEGPVTVTGSFTLSGAGILGGTVTGDGDTSTVLSGKMDQGLTRFFFLLVEAVGNGGDDDNGGGGGGCFIKTAIER